MAQCQRPITIKIDGYPRQVPCSKCPKCKARRISGWSFRLLQEDKKALTSYFITLTYNDENLPITTNGYRTLVKRDLQLFFKRLRKQSQKKGNQQRAIKYFAVGEYGGKIGRPHYHIILFNAEVRCIQQAWSQPKNVYHCNRYKRAPAHGITHKISYKKISSHLGLIHYGNKKGVSGASVGYTLKYILKPKNNRRHPMDDSQKEFALMSKGIGIDYLQPNMIAWHKKDLENRMYVNLEGGKKASMPRYYKEKIYTSKEKDLIAQAARIKLADEILKDIIGLSSKDHIKKIRNTEQAVKAAFRKQDSLLLKHTQYV